MLTGASRSSERALAHGVRPSLDPVDRLGALASGACATHCVLSGILPEALAAGSLGALVGHELELGLTLGALVLAAAALIVGWRKHRSRSVVARLGGGIVALLLARILDGTGETVCISLSILGGALLVSGHLSNIRASRRVRAATHIAVTDLARYRRHHTIRLSAGASTIGLMRGAKVSALARILVLWAAFSRRKV